MIDKVLSITAANTSNSAPMNRCISLPCRNTAVISGSNAGNMNAQNWRADSNYATRDIYAAHPEYFVPDTVGNLTHEIDASRPLEEVVAHVEAVTPEDIHRVADTALDEENFALTLIGPEDEE